METAGEEENEVKKTNKGGHPPARELEDSVGGHPICASSAGA
jgi:hypothetical protein